MRAATIRLFLVFFCCTSALLGIHSGLSAQDADYLRKAAKGAIFIYAAGTQPCGPPSLNQVLLPLGSGFVAGIPKKGTPEGRWTGWKFLVTARHVVGNRNSVNLRLNKVTESGFKCHELELVRDGENQNLFVHNRPEVDLVLISIPDIADTDPTVFDYSLFLDEKQMKNLQVQEGTEVFTVGYVWGYSGEKQNYPITRFGRVALLTDERWYRSSRNRVEEAYLVEMMAMKGLSGAPVMLQSPQIRVDPPRKLRFRRIPPFIVGVVKGILLSPVNTSGEVLMTPQGIMAVEPAYRLREILGTVAARLKSAGFDVELDPKTPSKE